MKLSTQHRAEQAHLASQMKRGLPSALLAQTVAQLAHTSALISTIKTRNELSLSSEGLRHLAGGEPSFELAQKAGQGFLEILESCWQSSSLAF